MTMPEAMAMAAAAMAGVCLGAFFFGGLWWTVRKGVASKRPALWFTGSLLVRTSVVLAGFYGVVSGGHGGRLLVSLLGFVLARLLVVRLTRSVADKRTRPAQEAVHAS
ncbi:MAG TPA: ATP synthase subunit I [Hyphomicrobiaceae bacterium]|nr:ATP synthase subunit I [Hyphomicrobiaceae bacterium]